MENKYKPFLKWAGSKYRIIDKVKSVLPEGRTLIEPFCGTCSVALNTNFEKYILADSNKDIINLYKILIQDKETFIDYSQSFFIPENNTEEKYYELREKFNTTDDVREKSALFVYLNRHAFNGLCRYNKKGSFNVPFGRYKKPYFPKEEMLCFIQKLQNAIFLSQDFEKTMMLAEKGDVIYCDPPYLPLSNTSSFTSYYKDDFSYGNQEKLVSKAQETSNMGIKVFISNHKTPESSILYNKAKITSFDVQRFISAASKGRKKVEEIIACYD